MHSLRLMKKLDPPKATITRDDWLAALRDAGLHDDVDQDAVTVSEFAKMMGLRVAAAQSRLAGLVAAGKAVRTKKRVADSNGRPYVYTAFRLEK
jgi:hypothetical protein